VVARQRLATGVGVSDRGAVGAGGRGVGDRRAAVALPAVDVRVLRAVLEAIEHLFPPELSIYRVPAVPARSNARRAGGAAQARFRRSRNR
jgi:hypothetical protein